MDNKKVRGQRYVGIYMPSYLKKWLDEQAYKAHRSVSEEMRQILIAEFRASQTTRYSTLLGQSVPNED